jgi:hypothetical protein
MRRVLLLAALALAGCGDAPDFSGEPEIPSGYATFAEQGVSFARPKGLPETRQEARIRFGDRTAFVELTVRRGKGEDFDGYVHSIVTLAEALGKSKVEETEQEVPGAQAARMLEIVSPPKKGANAEELHSRVLIVRRGPDILMLGAGAEMGSEEKVDAEAVIASFRLR